MSTAVDGELKSNVDPLQNEGVSAVQQRDPLVGTTLDGRFHIEEVLGSGGMSVVYKAKQLRVNRYVAIKTIRLQVEANSVIRERFQREVNTLCTLSHPNIVTVYDCIFGWDDQPYIVMDYLKGASLENLLRKSGAMDLDRFARITLQVLSALEHAHKNGVVHRDVKPGNVVLIDDESDIVKVVDFGLAKLGLENRKLTKSGELWGSPPYMSPEQAQGDSSDERSDIYSLGAVMFEMLTGRDPFFEVATVFELIQAHVLKDPPAFEHANANVDVPQAVQMVIYKALEKNPEDRYQSVGAFQSALVDALSGNVKSESADYILRFATRAISNGKITATRQPAYQSANTVVDNAVPGRNTSDAETQKAAANVSRFSSFVGGKLKPDLRWIPWTIAVCSLMLTFCLMALVIKLMSNRQDAAPAASMTPPVVQSAVSAPATKSGASQTIAKPPQDVSDPVVKKKPAPPRTASVPAQVVRRKKPQRITREPKSMSKTVSAPKPKETGKSNPDPWAQLSKLRQDK